MSDWQLKTPVAFIIFNRPDTTALVFAEIAKAKPLKLLVIADGPRNNRAGEEEKCRETRAIIEAVNWPCEVLTNFSDTNMGCKNRVSSGLDWVFEQVPEAIILEDDCLPDQSFFRFCEELLERYRDDERIGMISGDNFQFGCTRGAASYYFSRYNHIWGWATWRRAWQHYDKDISYWPQLRKSGWLNGVVINRRQRAYWERAFQSVYEGVLDTWDHQWTLTSWSRNMLSIMPNANLISNIGFGYDATHTKRTSVYSEMKRSPMLFPLNHPMEQSISMEADEFTERSMFRLSPLCWLNLAIQALFADKL